MRPPGVAFADQLHHNNNRHQFAHQQHQNGTGTMAARGGYGHKQPPLQITPTTTQQHSYYGNGGGRRVAEAADGGGLLPRHFNNNGGSAAGNGHLHQHHQQQRCHCCPYGFHIDLGFVKFAEDVAAGKEQIQNWSSPAKKRSRRLLASPSSDRTMLDLSDTTDDGGGANNGSYPLNDTSILSKSVEADDLPEMLELRSAVLPDRNSGHQYPSHHPPLNSLANGRSAPQSILKNATSQMANEWGGAGGYSNVPLRQNGGGGPVARSLTMASVDSYQPMDPVFGGQRHQQQHQSRYFHHHPPSGAGRSSLAGTPHSSTSAPTPPISRRFPLSVASDAPTSTVPMAGIIGSPIRTSTPRTNEEIQQILGPHHHHHQRPLHISTSAGHHQHRDHIAPAHHVNGHNNNNNGIGTISAPSSPVPKNFHTAIAQSMAQLKRTPSKATASTSWNSTSQAHTSLATLSAPARNAFSGAPSSSTPRLPYLELGHRHRMLSPEPSVDPMGQTMRNSNLQSRAFFHRQSNSTNNNNGNARIIPYRSRGGSTPSLDLGDFASVRRRRLDADIRDSPPTLPSSAQIMRSLSPPPFCPTPISTTSTTTATLLWRSPPPAASDSPFLPHSGLQTPVVDAQPPPPQRPIARAEHRVPVPIHAATVVRSAGTQTKARPANKEVGIGTDHRLQQKRHTKNMGTSPDRKFLLIPLAMAPASIGVDTSDLEPKKPPPPPPKPTGPELEVELQRRREIERMARWNKLSAEFQYCLGHEPEHDPGEEPPCREAERKTIDRAVDARTPPPKEITHSLGTSTSNLIHGIDVEVGTEEVRRAEKAIGTEENEGRRREVEVQTEEEETMKGRTAEEGEENAVLSESGSQTESEWLEAEIGRRLAEAEAERREKRKRRSVERSTETDEEDAPDQFIMITCNKCDQRSSVASDELFEKIIAEEQGEEGMKKVAEVEEGNLLEEEEQRHHHPILEDERVKVQPEEEDLLLDFGQPETEEEITPMREIDTIIEEKEEEEEMTAPAESSYHPEEGHEDEEEVELPSIVEEKNEEKEEDEVSEDDEVTITEKVVEVQKQHPDQKQTEQLEPPVQHQQHQNVSPLSSDEGLVLADGEDEEEDLGTMNGRGDAESDRISIETDVQTVICVDGAVSGENIAHRPGSSISSTSSSTIDGKTAMTVMSPAAARTEALRKMLTEPQRYQQSSFKRDAGTYRSFHRTEKTAADLDYIAERHKSDVIQEAGPSTPCSSAANGGDCADGGTRKALKETIALKKSPSPGASGSGSSSIHIPDPIPARIPRPKFTKYSPNVEHAETPDEEAEAADRLTPLRSEMRALSSSLWSSTSSGGGGSPRMGRALIFRAQIGNEEEEGDEEEFGGRGRGGRDEDQEENSGGGVAGMDNNDASSTSSEGARTYEMSEEEGTEFELSAPLREALQTINEHTLAMKAGGARTAARTEEQMHETEWAHKYAQHEWLKLATKKSASAELVEQFLDALESFSTPLMETVVNMTDQNGNTALHYAVSNENFDVVSVLLDSKVCRVDEMNKAGYSALMLGALCELRNETECAIIQRLFQMGNVNAKAVKHAQTALMLAASHGRVEATNLLLSCGADVNIQDVDGSTALMCAAEHGQKEIVKILLKRSNIDASLTDCDHQTALSIAVENQHRDIGVLIYAHLNFSRLENNDQSVSI